MASSTYSSNITDNLQKLLVINKKMKKNIKNFQNSEDGSESQDYIEVLQTQIKQMQEVYEQVENDIDESQSKEDISSVGKGDSSKQNASTVLEQEMIYELKVKQMKNLESQNANLNSELVLHRKLNENKQSKFKSESHLSKSTQLKLINALEKKGREAERKLNEMAEELHKLQCSVKKYQQLYEAEKEKNSSQSSSQVESNQDSDTSASCRQNKEPVTRNQVPYSARGYDTVRKNEMLMEENEVLKAEIKKLNRENTEYIRRAKKSDSERDTVLNRLETSEMARKDLLKRLQKEKTKHQQLSRSLTIQANDWVQMKKQLHQCDEEMRWSQVGSSGSCPRHASQGRPLPKSIYKPQRSQPAEQCAQ